MLIGQMTVMLETELIRNCQKWPINYRYITNIIILLYHYYSKEMIMHTLMGQMTIMSTTDLISPVGARSIGFSSVTLSSKKKKKKVNFTITQKMRDANNVIGNILCLFFTSSSLRVPPLPFSRPPRLPFPPPHRPPRDSADTQHIYK